MVKLDQAAVVGGDRRDSNESCKGGPTGYTISGGGEITHPIPNGEGQSIQCLPAVGAFLRREGGEPVMWSHVLDYMLF